MVKNDLLSSVHTALKNGTQKEALQVIDKIVNFCIEHENGKVFDGWDRETIRLMVAYHYAKGTIIVIFDDSEVKGVFMWYNCDSKDGWDFVQDWHPDREDSDSIFLAFLFASDTETFKELTKNFISIHPNYSQKKLIGIRYRKGFPTRVEYDSKLFNKILKLKD